MNLSKRFPNSTKIKMIKNRKIIVPWFPFSVLVFYLALLILWNIGIIPTPEELLTLVGKLNIASSIIGVFIAAFLEGLAFIGHEFPGISLIFISIIVVNNNFAILALIVATITLAFTLSSAVNYWAGTFFSSKAEKYKIEKAPRKTLFLSLIHPAFFSLYFFHKGMNKLGLKDLIFVPLLTFPYLLLVALTISHFSDFIRELLTSDLFFLLVFLGWFNIEFIRKNRKLLKKNSYN